MSREEDRDVNNRRKVETYICASPLTIKAPFTVRILYGNGANDSRPFCHSYGHFFTKGGIYLPANPGGISLFLLAFYTSPSYPPVHLFNLFCFLDARCRTFFSLSLSLWDQIFHRETISDLFSSFLFSISFFDNEIMINVGMSDSSWLIDKVFENSG